MVVIYKIQCLKKLHRIKNSKKFFKSKNINLAEQMCHKINSKQDKNVIIEIHNRPYLIDIIDKLVKSKKWYFIFIMIH